MSDQFTVVKYTFEGEKFEILVKPDPALDYKLGKIKDISSVLVSDEIYQNSSKGTRAPSEKLQKVFKTDDALIIAEKILQKGDLNLTTEQRRKMTTEKRKQIITFIAKTFVDPHSHLPHPPVRIEQAMSDARVSIDPFKNVEEQIKDIVENLRFYYSIKIRKSFVRNLSSRSICSKVLFCTKINRHFEKRRLAERRIFEGNTRNTCCIKTKRDR